MYCEHCGKKIDKDSKFCEYCGHKITDGSKIKNDLKNPKETKFLLIILLICIFGFIFYQELKYFNSPESAINNYLKDCKNMNYEAILANLNIQPNEFISSEILKKRAQNNEDTLIDDFKVLGCTYNDQDKTAKCEISYTTTKNGMNATKTYRLKRKESNRLLLFADWVVENQDIEILNQWTLYLPKDSKGSLEGIELDSYRNEEQDKTGYDAYLIPNILKGKYNLYLTTSNGLTLNSTIKASTNSYTYQFTLKDISEDLKKDILDLGEEVINTFYQGIIINKKPEELTSKYEISNILNDYDRLKKEITSDITLKEFKVMEIKITNLDLDEEGKILVAYQMNYQYKFDYPEKNQMNSHEGKSNDTFYVTIKNTDLKEIEKIDSLVSYFSKKY